MGQRQKRRSEEGEEGTSELENNEYGSVESRERIEKEFLVMEKSRRRAMRKRLPRRKGHSSVLGAIHPCTRSYSPLGRRLRALGLAEPLKKKLAFRIAQPRLAPQISSPRPVKKRLPIPGLRKCPSLSGLR